MTKNFAKRTATSVVVKKPKVRVAGAGLFTRTSPAPRRPTSKTRTYTKGTLKADPTEFFGVSFGNTGMTGES